jgi:hypothetical protein
LSAKASIFADRKKRVKQAVGGRKRRGALPRPARAKNGSRAASSTRLSLVAFRLDRPFAREFPACYDATCRENARPWVRKNFCQQLSNE